MKKVFFIVFLIASLTGMTAQPVDVNTARERAASFMAQRGLSLEQGSAPAHHRAGGKDNPFYIFNSEGGNGFVVISGDDRTEEILGYTTSGSYSSDEMPPAFAEWMENMSEQILSMQDTVIANRRSSSSSHLPAIEPLAKTLWGQSNPYNRLCPIINEKRCPSGCGATVAAQLMYYYQYPSQATSTIPGYNTEHAGTMQELAPITFDYEKMELDYSKGTYSEESAKAVSELMLYAGCAMKMDYDSDGSGTTMDRLKNALLTYFNYDRRTTRTVKRADYSTRDWNDLIYNELAQNRPVIYAGFSENQGGHVFLLDGYKDEALFHINWGWASKYDGYFRLFIMDPYYDSMACGFSLYQEAIIGSQPAASEDPVDMMSVSLGNSSGKAKLEVIDVQYDNLITVTQKVKVTVANTGNGDYSGNLFLYASKENEKPNKYAYRCGLGIEPDGSEEVDLFFNPTEEGTWYLWIANDYNEVLYNEEVYISPMGGIAKLEMVSYKIEPVSETTSRLTMSLSNISTSTLYSSIWVMVDENTHTRADEIHSGKQTLYPGCQMELAFTLKNLEEGKKYTITVLYFPNYGTFDINTFRISYCHQSATTIVTPEHQTVQPVAYYNLNGVRQDQPARGLNLMRLSNGKTIKRICKNYLLKASCVPIIISRARKC